MFALHVKIYVKIFFFKMSQKCFYCGIEAHSKCPDCGLVEFCCAQHFAHHKDEDRCQPFVVHFGGDDVGRFLRATRDIKVSSFIAKQNGFNYLETCES